MEQCKDLRNSFGFAEHFWASAQQFKALRDISGVSGQYQALRNSFQFSGTVLGTRNSFVLRGTVLS